MRHKTGGVSWPWDGRVWPWVPRAAAPMPPPHPWSPVCGRGARPLAPTPGRPGPGVTHAPATGHPGGFTTGEVTAPGVRQGQAAGRRGGGRISVSVRKWHVQAPGAVPSPAAPGSLTHLSCSWSWRWAFPRGSCCLSPAGSWRRQHGEGGAAVPRAALLRWSRSSCSALPHTIVLTTPDARCSTSLPPVNRFSSHSYN